MKEKIVVLLSAVPMVVGVVDNAFGYIGPGAGLSVIGTVIAFLGAILLAFVGFLWYPIKRLRAGRKNRAASAQKAEAK
jgi:hypothetical protein